MEYINNILEELINFRSLMGLSLSEENIKYIWGKRYLKTLRKGKEIKLGGNESEIIQKKIDICKTHIKKLKIFNWVQFIGISGSVAAGFARDDDDIDMFIVVRNGTMWIYRGIVVFLNIFHNRVRAKRHKDVRDKLCINLICEERGLQFEDDIFNFHELMFLKPVCNEKYINYIYLQNKWLEEKYGVKKENLQSKITPKKKVFFLIRVINYLAFLAQLLFMFVVGHSPDIKELTKNYKEGKIEFFEHDYREEVMENYLKGFKSTN